MILSPKITKTDAPDYHKIVKRPMDLGTIRSSINRMKYSCNNEVIEDIRLVFDNCRLYNKEDAEEYQCGKRLERYLCITWSRMSRFVPLRFLVICVNAVAIFLKFFLFLPQVFQEGDKEDGVAGGRGGGDGGGPGRQAAEEGQEDLLDK